MKEDATFRLFVENIGHTAVEEFVGNIGDVFYDPLTGDLRLSDGETAGGVSITSGSSIIEPPGPGEEISPGDVGDIVAVPNVDGKYFLYVYDGTDWQETYLTNAQVLTGDESPFTAAPGQLRQITLPDGTTLDNQQDINIYFATTVHQLKEDFETKIEEIDGRLDTNELDISVLKDTVVDLNEADGDLSDRLDVLETDPVTKEYVDDQDDALSDRLDVLETDPVTKKYVDDQDDALSGRLNVLETDPTTKKYVDDELAKLEAAVDAASGGLIFIDDFSVANPLPDPSTLERGNFFICSSDTPYQDPQLTGVANEGDKAIVDDELGYVLINEVDADTLYLSKTGDDTTTGTITAAGLKSNTLNSVGTTLNLGVSNSVTRISIDSSYTTIQGMVKVRDLHPLTDDININGNLSFAGGLKIKGNGVDQLIIGQSDVSYLGGITSDKHIVTREYLESQAYELPVATVSTLGGIKIGPEFGLNNDDQLTLNPTTVATTSDLGFVKVGSNLDVTNNGTLSVKTDGGLDSRYIKKTGDTITGTLTLSGDRAVDLNVDVTSGKIGNLKYNGNNRVGWGRSQVFVSGELVIQDPGGTTETGGIKMNGKKIYGLADPTADQHAATKKYVDTETSFLQNGIIELEEELEALAPALERGTWLFNPIGAAGVGQYGLFALGTSTNEYPQADHLFINSVDSTGKIHNFDDVGEGTYLEIFSPTDGDFGLYQVVENNGGTQGANAYWDFTLNHLQSNRLIADAEGVCRFKFFNLAEGADASSFVLKRGDTMTGALEFDRPKFNDLDGPLFSCGSIDANYTSTPNLKITTPGALYNNSVYKTEFRVENPGSGTGLFDLNYNGATGMVQDGNRESVATFEFGIRNYLIANNSGIKLIGQGEPNYLGVSTASDGKVLNWSSEGIDLNAKKVANIADPTEENDAASKKYVDDKFDFSKYNELS